MSARAQAGMASLLPQVNLLPPEVKAARGLARVKRWLGFVILLVLLVAAGPVLLATMAQRTADAELAVHQQETERLVSEQARYAEVPVVLAALDRARTAREVGMSTEIVWRPYLYAIAATAPEGVRIETLRYQGITPMMLAAAPADALAAWSVGTITFTAQSTTTFDTEAWLRSLVTVPGFADPWFSTATLTSVAGDSGDAILYNVTATVQVNEQAFANRFPAVEQVEEEQ